MKRWLIVLVACSGSAKTPAVQPVVVAPKQAIPVAVLPVAPAGSQMVGHPQTRDPIEAPHGGLISLVAETSDGKAAITSDDLGGMRLWTALDGTREPLVVDVAIPHDLAIARHPDGFFVATLDSANNLSLVVLDDRGRSLRHAAISSDAGFVGIEMTDLGVLAWARDQTVALYDLEGVQVARLGTEPGQRIVNIAANGTKAIAVVDADGGTKMIAHELTLPKLAWGPALDVGDAIGAIAITRSGKRIAIETVTELRVLEGGKPIFTQPLQNTVEIGFGDDNRLALGIGNGVTWLDLAQKPEPGPIGSQATVKALFATGDGMALTALGGELMVAKPNDPQYLGYAIESPQVATSGPSGNLVVGVGSDFAQLDSSLLMVANAPTPKSPPSTLISELQWIGGADYLASVASPNGTNDVMVLSSDGRDAQSLDPAKTIARTVRPVRYEASTHLITISFGDLPAIQRWNPDKRRAEKVRDDSARHRVPTTRAGSGRAHARARCGDRRGRARRENESIVDRRNHQEGDRDDAHHFVRDRRCGGSRLRVDGRSFRPAARADRARFELGLEQEDRDAAARGQRDAVAGSEGHSRARDRYGRCGALPDRWNARMEASARRRERSGVVR